MLRKIIGTTGARILNAVISLIILVLITRNIGSEGLGIIGLILVDVAVIQLSVDLVAGSSLVYFASRANIAQLLVPAYIFVIIVLLIFFLLGLLGNSFFPTLFYTIVPEGYFAHILGLSAISSFMSIHYNLLMGKSRIAAYNIIFTIQIIVLLAAFSFFILALKNQTVAAYLYSLYLAFGIAALLGFYTLISVSGKWFLTGWKKVSKEVFNYGFITQVANLLSIGNNRLSFFIIKYFSGLSALGIFNAGIQTTEGFKLIGQSIAVVQFSAISNTRDLEYSRKLSIQLMKVSILITLAAVFVINILPESFYTWLFSDSFIGVKPVIMALSPGVLALAANNIFSHYFSGIGKPKVNLSAKLLGLVFTIILAFTLIPTYGFIGAGITASVSYIATVVYQFFIFKNETGTQLKEWVPRKKDVGDLIILVRALKEKKNE